MTITELEKEIKTWTTTDTSGDTTIWVGRK